MVNIEILGFTEETTTCDRCGKTELKGTYCIDVDGTEMYLGSSCIAKRFEMTDKQVSRLISSEKKRLRAERIAKRNEIFTSMNNALKGLDFWNDYDKWIEIEKPFKKQLELI